MVRLPKAGIVCPFCKSDNIVWNDGSGVNPFEYPNDNNGFVEETYQCLNCEKRWRNLYTAIYYGTILSYDIPEESEEEE